MDIKDWLTKVILNKAVPSLVNGAAAGALAYLAAKSGVLAPFGVAVAGHVISLDMDKLSIWLITAGPGGVMSLLAVLQHHAGAAIKAKVSSPQDPPEGQV